MHIHIWRLESSKYKEVDGKKVYLHNEDYHYTIDEFKKFMNDSNDLSVNIVPELDFPAHALSITKIWKEFAVKKFGTNANGKRTLVDHIDITNPDLLNLLKKFWMIIQMKEKFLIKTLEQQYI
ncbi:family 20 glycosylhydrolase [Mycoplasmopsis cynos]|uniref:family 20 glycosylhydrolase n=1 Tax=Mycoplasmopsis cynos TaxID=171284 RepID=UPI00220687B2|nr:family 20 glycosylhydrolase [Mycoplasmopsis cynos]UWV92556.1 family 20 glycosylhydrolase [Mycoplasmopsis cynos]